MDGYVAKPRRMRFRAGGSIALVTALGCAMVVVEATPASACTCGGGAVAQAVEEAPAVYIARARLFDIFPGASFRVTRVLKGPPVSNLRVKVTGGSGASCGTTVRPGAPYVIPVGDWPLRLSLCSEYLRGASAVEEAIDTLGAGRAVPWRPDLLWASQWAILIALLAAWLWRRTRRRRRLPQPFAL